MAPAIVSPEQTAPLLRQPVLQVDLKGVSIQRKPILGRIKLDVDCGETVAITGPSGIGKSTLLRVISGLEKGYDGQVRRPDKLAFVFQEPTLLLWRSLRDNLMLPLGISKEMAEESLAEVGLSRRSDDFPKQLSLGQQRRLSLARAFAGSPPLLLMDEPFVSLDPKLADEMMQLFETLRARRAVATLLVTHSPEEANRLATRIIRIDGSPAEIMNSDQDGIASI